MGKFNSYSKFVIIWFVKYIIVSAGFRTDRMSNTGTPRAKITCGLELKIEIT